MIVRYKYGERGIWIWGSLGFEKRIRGSWIRGKFGKRKESWVWDENWKMRKKNIFGKKKIIRFIGCHVSFTKTMRDFIRIKISAYKDMLDQAQHN